MLLANFYNSTPMKALEEGTRLKNFNNLLHPVLSMFRYLLFPALKHSSRFLSLSSSYLLLTISVKLSLDAQSKEASLMPLPNPHSVKSIRPAQSRST